MTLAVQAQSLFIYLSTMLEAFSPYSLFKSLFETHAILASELLGNHP